jgi:DNA-binding XRE family transcriptional regulator
MQQSYRATVLLHHYIAQCGRSRTALAAALGIAPATLAELEAGQVLADGALARALEREINAPLNLIFIKAATPIAQSVRLQRMLRTFGVVSLVGTLIVGLLAALLYIGLSSNPALLAGFFAHSATPSGARASAQRSHDTSQQLVLPSDAP